MYYGIPGIPHLRGEIASCYMRVLLTVIYKISAFPSHLTIIQAR